MATASILGFHMTKAGISSISPFFITEFSEPLKDTHDGLRGFELKDADGYVLFFGRPRSWGSLRTCAQLLHLAARAQQRAAGDVRYVRADGQTLATCRREDADIERNRAAPDYGPR